MAVRELLHKTKLEAFGKWLESDGWALLPPKGEYEVLKAKKTGKKTLMVWHKADVKEHYVIEDKYRPLVRQFIKSERGGLHK